MSRYQFIATCTEPWPVQVLCHVLAVSAAGYYPWRQRPAAVAVPWYPAAQAAFTRHARQHGTRWLRAELRAEGHAVGRCALRSWRRRNGLRALSTRPQRPRTAVSDPAAIGTENRLLGQPAPTAPDQVGVGDITYLPLVDGRWCYLAIWRDACSRQVVGLVSPQRHLAPGRADAHRTGAHGLGAGPDATPTSSWSDYPR
jgi:hypothetical protein